MMQRPHRFAIEQPVEFRFTDVRGCPSLTGRTINISSTGVLMHTDETIGVGRKLEVVVRMPPLTPECRPIDLRLLGMAVRSGEGWVAIHARKSQMLKKAEPGSAFTESSGTPPGSGSTLDRTPDPAD